MEVMRLIDAVALGIGKSNREIFDHPAYSDGWNAAIDIIEKAPTAYDPDKVVKALRRAAFYEDGEWYLKRDVAIEIVRKGGVE